MTPRARVTGFGPFGAVTSNPSAPIAAALAAGLVARGWDARHETLAVTFEEAQAAPLRLLAAGPALLVHVGVAESRRHVSLERSARRAAGDRPDVAGRRSPPRLDPSGPPERATTLDVHALRRALSTPLDVEVSDDCGDYVCNALYYASLALAPGGRSLFVHVPLLDDDGARALGHALAEALVVL
ncbi:MAG: hypothetical protein IT374_09905 [Polyangiaceae bacterium]|nr:hypothetical protein [Polyangiaceae bacterium]